MRILLLFLLLGLTVSSCFQTVDMNFSKEERLYIDSIYKINRKNIKIEVDSICTIKNRDLYPKIVDSIRREYIREIQSIVQ